jgi:hypothetical protein
MGVCTSVDGRFEASYLDIKVTKKEKKILLILQKKRGG